MPTIISDDTLYGYYKQNLAEGLSPEIREEFNFLADGVRENILLNEVTNRGGFTPQTILALPVLRMFWPNLVARELFTMIPMDQPTKMHTFLFPYFTTVDGRKVRLPQHWQARDQFSSGFEIPYNSPDPTPVNAQTDILNLHGLTSTQAKIQHDFAIIGYTWSEDPSDDSKPIYDGEINLQPDDEGNFSFEARVSAPGEPVKTNFVSGHVDYVNGVIDVSAHNSGGGVRVIDVFWTGSLTGAEENIAPTLQWEQKKIQINAVDYMVQAQWTIQMEQDYKAYFDLNIQALNIDTLAQQVAQDIDSRLIRLIDNTIARYRNNPEVNKTFSKTPRLGFAGTNREWYDEIYNPINEVSTNIELDTNMGPANIIAANPLGIHVLSMSDRFAYKGDTQSGEMGRTPYAGSFANSWRVVSSPRIPANKLYIINKSDNMERASAVFCPYRVMVRQEQGDIRIAA